MLLGMTWTIYDFVYFLKGTTKSLLMAGVGGILARLMPRLTLSGRSLRDPNFFDPKHTWLLHLLSFASLFHSDVEMFAGCVKHCVLQRCPTEIQAPFNEDILTVYESSNRPLSKAKTHFPTQFQTFNNFPDHCTGSQYGMNSVH